MNFLGFLSSGDSRGSGDSESGAPEAEAALPAGKLRIEKLVYGGGGLAHTVSGQVALIPFTLPGELVEVQPTEQAGMGAGVETKPSETVRVLEPSPDRVKPACVHFGTCGGCQYQMAAYPAQLAAKAEILREVLTRAGLDKLPALQTWASPEPYGYRNRIRLRVRQVGGELRLGYSVRGTQEFLPIRMCPIAAPALWRAAEALQALAGDNREAKRWLGAAAEVEIFCTPDASRLQLTLLCPGKPLRNEAGFRRFAEALHGTLPTLSGAGAARLEPRSGRALETLAAWGAPGLPYTVHGELYWVTRGGFFQVNRFLLPTLTDLVTDGRTGEQAWDLFAGVGLFSRLLARRFGAVTAVEANPAASRDLRAALAKLGAQHRAVEATTLLFLRRAVLERERPELIVLDPPRAGAGEEACTLLARLAPRQIVYLSCDPTTLARDLAVLTRSGYGLGALHLIDLFPQTYHLETLAVLNRIA